MFLFAWLKRLRCRRLLTLILFSYFLMILLFILNLDFTENDSHEEESFALIFPQSTFNIRRDSLSNLVNRSSHGRRMDILETDALISKSHYNVQNKKHDLDESGRINNMIQFVEPVPLLEPSLDNKVHRVKSGDFISLGEEVYVYSAFIDDRKEQSFIRIMTLMSQAASRHFIYCHFNDSPQPTRSTLYQLCENHNKLYGGYFYSCQMPDDGTSSHKLLTTIVISLNDAGARVRVPLHSVQPPEEKLEYLNLYPQESDMKDDTNKKTVNVKLNVPSIQLNVNNSSGNERSPSGPTLSFAICVSPLFGNISVHRLVEFVELSRLLGAQHFIFYNHSVPQQISDVLRYYMSKQIASVLPWALPPQVVNSVWYYSQLLANNDCLYRTMPHFDLVSFNDIDEFVVPHSNASTWKEAFSSLLTDDRCGFSFQSAFYDPGIRETTDSTLLTPVLTAKSETYSKVRTKVMLCPWRVFEVGIHHISKQNQENWHSWGVPPSLAYLHHYRRCVSNFGMPCGVWEKDLTIANRYLTNLTLNYERVLNNIFLLRDSVRD